jgi:hypothetical protein
MYQARRLNLVMYQARAGGWPASDPTCSRCAAAAASTHLATLVHLHVLSCDGQRRLLALGSGRHRDVEVKVRQHVTTARDNVLRIVVVIRQLRRAACLSSGRRRSMRKQLSLLGVRSTQV